MGLNTRPASCSTTNKRLRRKSWYYRNGKYYYNKRAWEQDKEKAATEKAAAKETAAKEAAKAETPAAG
jgi:hypothetical protein